MLTVKVMNSDDFGYRAFHVHDYQVEDRTDGAFILLDAAKNAGEGVTMAVQVTNIAYIVNEIGKTVDTIHRNNGRIRD